jgi:endonuclease/exonuclease/phosphatase family metal-dependent hydrolase
MPEPLRLISLNVEGSKHLPLVASFLKEERADIVCLQEAIESDLPALIGASGASEHMFVPMMRRTIGERVVVQGIAILSRLALTDAHFFSYGGDGDGTNMFDNTDAASKHATQRYVCAVATIQAGGKLFRIATTHFVWTPDGSATDEYQRRDIETFLALLQKEGEVVVCGDFNANRGGEIFSKIAQRYKDTIPPHYTTSIDGSLHRAGPLPYMVDGLFTTPLYTAADVTLRPGVSDHCAIVAVIR